MKTNAPAFLSPIIIRHSLVIFQKQLEPAIKYLFRNSQRYGFEPRQGPGIAGYVESNALYLEINAAKHLVCSLDGGAEPRVKMGRLDMEPALRPDAYVWVSKSARLPLLGGRQGVMEKRPFVSSSRLHEHMREVRLRTNSDTTGVTCDVLVSREFQREFASLTLDIVQFRV